MRPEANLRCITTTDTKDATNEMIWNKYEIRCSLPKHKKLKLNLKFITCCFNLPLFTGTSVLCTRLEKTESQTRQASKTTVMASSCRVQKMTKISASSDCRSNFSTSEGDRLAKFKVPWQIKKKSSFSLCTRTHDHSRQDVYNEKLKTHNKSTASESIDYNR